jgi:hypothetical protein
MPRKIENMKVQIILRLLQQEKCRDTAAMEGCGMNLKKDN